MTDTTNLPAGHNPLVDSTDFTFRFRKDKMEIQRPTVVIKSPVPSVEGIKEIYEAGGKGLELLQEVMGAQIRAAINSWVSDDEKASQETFDASKYTWEAIANQSREDRRASGIPAEVWEAFSKDYIEVMPAVTGKSMNFVQTAAEVFVKKFAPIKTNKPLINKLKDTLALYLESSKNAETFVDVVEFLLKKADLYLKADETATLLSNLDE